jgi:hypothetical protein
MPWGRGFWGGGGGINSSIFIALVGFDLHRPIGLSVPTEPTTFVGRTKFGGFYVSESTQGDVYREFFTLQNICGFSAPFL